MKKKLKINHDKRSYAVFGMGDFGKTVAIELEKSGADVMAIDRNEERITDVADYVTDARIMDATDVRAYARLGLANMDGVVIALTGNMDASIIAILQATEAGIRDIIVKSVNEIQTEIYRRLGATQIVTPEISEGIRLARTLSSTDIFDFVSLRDDICMLELQIPEEWNNKTLAELKLRTAYQLNVIAVLGPDSANLVIDSGLRLTAGDHLLVVTDRKTAEGL